MNNTEYQGWSNRATYNAKMWWDASFQYVADELVPQYDADNTYNCKKDLSLLFEAVVYKHIPTMGREQDYFADMIECTIASVDFEEIAEYYITLYRATYQ